ncbi:MAG TPA: co-chaperone GroES [Planctomycetota bacterium]|nr:co-chaperone GroES [Planctomycetota bacterium]
MARAVKPLDDRVLIKRLEAEERTAGGIVLPDTAKEKPQKGKIIAVGSGKLLDKGGRSQLTVKPGDTVLFGKYAGTEIKIDGEEHTIMRESELLGVLEE